MKIEYLHEFIQLAEIGNFQQTVENLYISESTLSKHIKALEEEMGILLFERRSRKLFLNKYGEAFLPYAKEIVGQYLSWQKELSDIKWKEGSQLHIGLEAPLGSYGVYSTLSKFRQQFPSTDVIVHEGHHPELVKLLQTGECNFVFTNSPLAFPDYRKLFFAKDHLVIAISKNHALAKEKCITAEQLTKERMVIHEPQFDYDPFWLLCQAAGFIPTIEAKIFFNSAVLKLVEISEGIAVMGSVQAKEHNNSNVLFLPFSPEIPYNVYLVYDEAKTLPPIASNFLSFFSNEINGYPSEP